PGGQRRPAPRARPAREGLALDPRRARPEAGQGGGGRPGGLDRPHHLGRAHQRPGLPGPGRGLEPEPGPYSVRSRRPHGEMVRTWVGTLRSVIAPRARRDDWNPIRVTLAGQRPSKRPHQQAGYMTAPDCSPITSSAYLPKGGRPYMTPDELAAA